MKSKKALLVAMIAPAIMAGCQSTSGSMDPASHNDAVKSQLSPVAEFFTGHVFEQCEREITFDNYQQVLSERQSGLYRSPIDKRECIPISFNEQEPESFYEELMAQAADKDAAREVVSILKGSANFDGADSRHIQKIALEDGRVAQVMKFTDGKAKEHLTSMWRNRDQVLLHLDEYVFLHELFHTSSMNFDKTLPKNISEGMSDVSAAFVITSKHKMTIEQSYDFVQDLMRARQDESRKISFSSIPNETGHYKKSVFIDLLDHIEKLQDERMEMTRVSGFNDANNVGYSITLRMDEIERTSLGDAYWEPGMQIAMSQAQRDADAVEVSRFDKYKQGFSSVSEIAAKPKPKEKEVSAPEVSF